MGEHGEIPTRHVRGNREHRPHALREGIFKQNTFTGELVNIGRSWTLITVSGKIVRAERVSHNPNHVWPRFLDRAATTAEQEEQWNGECGKLGPILTHICDVLPPNPDFAV